jgi:ribose/xylose/arabinose/galactoside ABC-type transport system permease subunit
MSHSTSLTNECKSTLGFAIAEPQFLTAANLFNLLRQVAPNCIIATGMAVVMIAGGIDLSVGAMLSLAGVVIASQINSGSPVLGNDAPLYAIAAVLLGGISMRGGSGSLIGMLLGAAILGVLANGLNVSGVGGSYQIVVVGASWSRRSLLTD